MATVSGVDLKLVPLVPRGLTPDQAVIEKLEYLLAQAREGKVAGIAGAWVDEKYEVAYFRRGVCNASMVGGLATIQMLICQHVTDTAEKL